MVQCGCGKEYEECVASLLPSKADSFDLLQRLGRLPEGCVKDDCAMRLRTQCDWLLIAALFFDLIKQRFIFISF